MEYLQYYQCFRSEKVNQFLIIHRFNMRLEILTFFYLIIEKFDSLFPTSGLSVSNIIPA